MFEDLKRDILRSQLVDEDGLILEACCKKSVKELMLDDQDDMSDYEDDPDIERLIDGIPEDTSEEGCKVREGCTKEGCSKTREGCSKEGCCGKKKGKYYDDDEDDDDDDDDEMEEACKESYSLISEQYLIESLIEEIPETELY